MPRYALSLAYVGAAFGGWDDGREAVCGQPSSALATLRAGLRRLGENGPVEGACRLDAGVHAAGQCAHVECARNWDPQALASALDHQLPPAMACRAAAAVADDWHAAVSATAKTYRYRLDRSQPRDPRLAAISWRVPGALDRGRLHQAARLLRGGGDLSGFLRRSDHRDRIATVLHALRWSCRGQLWTCTITGDRFAYRLVRSLVAAMVRCAGDHGDPSALAAVLRGTDHPISGHCAPAWGLELAQVHYPQEPHWQLAEA